MAANSHKYYLSIDDNIVDFNYVIGFKNMESFLRLSIFTGLFKNRKHLIDTLCAMGLIDSTNIGDISIVKRIGNRSDGYDYNIVTYDIVYKDAVEFLSVGAIKEFLYRNRTNYEAILNLLEFFHSNFYKLTSIFEVKVYHLERQLSQVGLEERDEIKDEIEKRRNSLNNFRNSLLNIEELRAIIRILMSDNYIFNRRLELEYIERLDKFAEDEVYYVRGNKKTLNFRGIVRFAIAIQKLYIIYKALYKPYTIDIHSKTRLEFLKAIKENINIKSKDDNIGDSDICDDDVEPDSFMFLEPDDFRSLLREDSFEEEVMSVENSILNLEEKQRSFVIHEKQNK